MFALTPFNRRDSIARPDDFSNFYDMIDGFFNDSFLPFKSMSNQNFKMDVKENEKEYIVDADLPGFSKEQIKLDLVNNQLMISAYKNEETEQKEENYLHRERRLCSMQRGVFLKDITGEDITAKFENGVLQVVVPKNKKQESRTQIEIN